VFLKKAVNDGVEGAFAAMRVADKSAIIKANAVAIKKATERAAELVGKKLVEGRFVDNPDAEWSITETTRDHLRVLVEQALTEETYPSDLAGQIEASAGFSADRAEMIARTELKNITTMANLEAWKASGVVDGKRSVLSFDHDVPDECDDASEDGVIGIDEVFSTGDDGPPYHPRCMCSLKAVMIPREELESDEGEAEP
jgi:hypothetical protein